MTSWGISRGEEGSVKRGVAVGPICCRGSALLVAVFCAIALHAPSAQAKTPFNGTQAGGATFGAGLIAGIACWTLELGTQDRWAIEEEVEERDDDYERVGWYGQLSGTYVLEVIDDGKEEEGVADATSPAPIDFEFDSRHSGGIGFGFGRRCHERVSVEVDIDWMVGGFEGDFDSPTEGTLQKADYEFVAATVNAKGHLLTGRIQPYVLLGTGTLAISTETKTVSNGVKKNKETGNLLVRGGGGVDFYVTRNWVLNVGADYLWSATNLDYFDFFTFGVGVQHRW